MKSAEKKDVLIIGGGMVGMSLALALGKQGLQVALFEREIPESTIAPAFDGRVSAIAYGTAEWWQSLGVWQAMEPGAQPILDIRIVDANSPLKLHYDHQDVGNDPMGWIVENRHLRKALIEATRAERNISWKTPSSVEFIQFGPGLTEIVLKDGKKFSAPLLAATDGKNSRTRKLAGITHTETPYAQTAIVCTVAHEYSHEGLALERFLPVGPFAVLPLQDDEEAHEEDNVRLVGGRQRAIHRSSIVWTEKSTLAESYAALDDVNFNYELQRRFGDYLGKVSVVGQRWTYPLSLMTAESMIGPRLALVGDAAHAIHPIAGQGVNLGLRDAMALSAKIGEAARVGLDIGAPDILEAYEKARRFDVASMTTVTDSLNHLFSNDFWPVKAARRLGLAGVERLSPLKKLFMRHAMGKLLPTG